MRYFLYLFLLICVVFDLQAQSKASKRERDRKEYIYKKELSFGARLTTNGWSLFGETAKIKTIHKTRVIQFEVQIFKNRKEKKQSVVFDPIGNTKDFIYGKRNNFFALHANYGFKKRIADKANKAGVRVSMVYLGGVSLGFLKPYYLDLIQPDGQGTFNVIDAERYTEENADRFLNIPSIWGASGFRYGWGEIEPVPGLHGKFGLNFDWANHDEILKALEAGVMADVYYKKIPIMVDVENVSENSPYFLGVYLSVQFGKRW